MILLCRLISIFSFLLLSAFGAVASFATPGDWQQFSYPIEAQDLVAQHVKLTNTARAPPTTNANVVTTGTALAQTGDLRALDEVETTGAVYALLRSSIAPNSVARPSGIPDNWIVKPTNKGGGTRYTNPDNPHDFKLR